MKLDEGTTEISLCTWTFQNNFKKIIFWIKSSLVTKYCVISMISRPNTSPWSETEEFPHAKETTDVEAHGQNDVDLFFEHREYHLLLICARRDQLSDILHGDVEKAY
jgi:hypothetical protein